MEITKFDTNWDVQKYFSPHEPAHHWQLRKAFMQENKERYCEERLVCLAQTFANMEFMGCRYPEAITKVVDEMSFGIVQPFREQQKGRLKRTFISGADAAEVKMNKKKLNSRGNNSWNKSQNKSITSKYGNFVPASIENTSNATNKSINDSSISISDQINQSLLFGEKLEHTQNLSDWSFESKIAADSESSITITDQINQSQLFGVKNELSQNLLGGTYNNVSMQETMAQIKNLKEQLQAIIEKGEEKHNDSSVLCLSDYVNQDEIVDLDETEEIELINDSHEISHKDEIDAESMSEFIIIKLRYNPDQDPREILRQSADFCKVTCSFQYKKSMMKMGPRLGATVPRYECTVCIENDGKAYCAVGEGLTEKDSAITASKECLQNLEKYCHTIMIKHKYTSGDDSFIDSSTFESKDKCGKVIDKKKKVEQSNIGHKLLKMMGWSDGGLGKNGQGIVEPIKPADLTGRQGFGWDEQNGTGRYFKNKVRKILEEYASSNNPYDLIFSSGLTSEQRHEIHVKAAMFKLKHKSFGKGDDRFITISKKFQKDDIIAQLKKNGGSNAKFELLLPKK